jgi:hypothetical protein
LANSWIVLNAGGGLTPGKPEVFLEAQRSQDSELFPELARRRHSGLLRRAKGARFLTEPLDNQGWEMRCYVRGPDGYLIEVGQYSRKAIDLFEEYND